jgi:hypothetical protein
MRGQNPCARLDLCRPPRREVCKRAKRAHMQVSATCLGAKRLSSASPRSAGTELRSPPREAKLLLSSSPFSDRFCPRVFGQNRHFSQKSALYWPQIRALLWAYRGPESARMQARVCTSPQHTCPGATRQSSSNLISNVPLPMYSTYSSQLLVSF